MGHKFRRIEVIAFEPGVAAAELRGQMPAQRIERAFLGKPKRETLRVDRLLPFGDGADLPVGKARRFLSTLEIAHGWSLYSMYKQCVATAKDSVAGEGGDKMRCGGIAPRPIAREPTSIFIASGWTANR
jgi:hypothetical protein